MDKIFHNQICDEEERKKAGLMISEYCPCVRLFRAGFFFIDSQNQVPVIPCTNFFCLMDEEMDTESYIKKE